MCRLAKAIAVSAVLAAGCTTTSPVDNATLQQGAPQSLRELVVSAAASAAFARYSVLEPQSAAPSTVEQAEYFADIEQLLLGARQATSNWNGELFLRAAQDQFWRQGLDVPVIEKLGLVAKEDVTGFRSLVARRIEETDSGNTAFLKAELSKRGAWPAISEIGDGASHFAWLLVQHADRDPDFQKHSLDLMAPLVATREVFPPDYAYLLDRVAVAEHRPQQFGTQGHCVEGEERWEPWPIEESEAVEDRRSSVGLVSMAEYEAVFAERRLCEGR